MNKTLTTQIVKHIMDNLGMTNHTSNSILDSKFMFQEYLALEGDSIPIYGAEIKIGVSDYLRIVGVEFEAEYYLLSKLDNCPLYGCQLSMIEMETLLDHENMSGNIYFALEKNNWIECSIAIQATFLAGMENTQDIVGESWQPINKKSAKELKDSLESLIKYFDFTHEG